MAKRSHIDRCLLCRREIPRSTTRPRKFCDDGGVCKQAYYEARKRLRGRYPAMHRQVSRVAFMQRDSRRTGLDQRLLGKALGLELDAARAYRLGDVAARREARAAIQEFASTLGAREASSARMAAV